eukprot:scaffold8015_cov165-Ochromonas_danica.AAC.39
MLTINDSDHDDNQKNSRSDNPNNVGGVLSLKNPSQEDDVDEDSSDEEDRGEETLKSGLKFLEMFNDPAMNLQDVISLSSNSPNPRFNARKHVKRENKGKQREDSSCERAYDDEHLSSDYSMDSASLSPTRGNEVGQSSSSSTHALLASSSKKRGSGGGHRLADNPQARAKNREHAKNTRLRKRMYIESLRESIKKISDERENIDRDRKAALGRFAEQVSIKKAMLQEFLSLRSTGSTDVSKWSKMLEENFILVMEGQRVVKGFDRLLRDQSSLKVMTLSMLPPTSSSVGDSERSGDDSLDYGAVEWKASADEIIVSDENIMCRWEMTTVNACVRGARFELAKMGMLKAVFSSNSRLVYVEEIFDVMGFMQQLRRASGRADFIVVPNTLALAKEGGAKDARIVTEAVYPYRIVYVSPAWCLLFGFAPEYVLGQTCRIIQGPMTNKETIKQLMEGVKAMVKNYSKSGEMINNWIRVYPLYAPTGAGVTHFVGIMERLGAPALANQSFYSSASSSTNNSLSASSFASRSTNQIGGPNSSFSGSLSGGNFIPKGVSVGSDINWGNKSMSTLALDKVSLGSSTNSGCSRGGQNSQSSSVNSVRPITVSNANSVTGSGTTTLPSQGTSDINDFAHAFPDGRMRVQASNQSAYANNVIDTYTRQSGTSSSLSSSSSRGSGNATGPAAVAAAASMYGQDISSNTGAGGMGIGVSGWTPQNSTQQSSNSSSFNSQPNNVVHNITVDNINTFNALNNYANLRDGVAESSVHSNRLSGISMAYRMAMLKRQQVQSDQELQQQEQQQQLYDQASQRQQPQSTVQRMDMLSGEMLSPAMSTALFGSASSGSSTNSGPMQNMDESMVVRPGVADENIGYEPTKSSSNAAAPQIIARSSSGEEKSGRGKSVKKKEVVEKVAGRGRGRGGRSHASSAIESEPQGKISHRGKGREKVDSSLPVQAEILPSTTDVSNASDDSLFAGLWREFRDNTDHFQLLTGDHENSGEIPRIFIGGNFDVERSSSSSQRMQVCTPLGESLLSNNTADETNRALPHALSATFSRGSSNSHGNNSLCMSNIGSNNGIQNGNGGFDVFQNAGGNGGGRNMAEIGGTNMNSLRRMGLEDSRRSGNNGGVNVNNASENSGKGGGGLAATPTISDGVMSDDGDMANALMADGVFDDDDFLPEL